MTHLVQFLAIVLGAMSGGSLFMLASQGVISWWLVALVFAWVISIGAYAYLLMIREDMRRRVSK